MKVHSVWVVIALVGCVGERGDRVGHAVQVERPAGLALAVQKQPVNVGEEEAKELVTRDGDLFLSTPIKLSADAERILASHPGSVMIRNLNELSTVELAEKLVASDVRDWLELNSLTSISPEAARSLAKHKGTLELNALTAVSDEVAEALATHEGEVVTPRPD
jgi:hypothetical protein